MGRLTTAKPFLSPFISDPRQDFPDPYRFYTLSVPVTPDIVAISLYPSGLGFAIGVQN